MNSSFTNIYVLGGHRLAMNYVERLKRAMGQQLIKVGALHCVDADPHCTAMRHPDPGVRFINQAYAGFIVELLGSPSKLPGSIIIPDHTAPHVLMMVFVEMLKRCFPQKKIEVLPFDEPLGLPFQKTFDSGICAVSYATWTCPLECEEPKICPAIQSERTWDFGRMFREYEANHASLNSSLHLFLCEPIAYGVCGIPVNLINNAWLKLKSCASQDPRHEFMVATFSKCHGIIGRAHISDIIFDSSHLLA